MRTHFGLMIALSVGVLGCQPAPPTPAVVAPPASAAPLATSPVRAGVAIVGRVLAPTGAGLIGDGGGTTVAAGGGNLIGAGGGTLIGKGGTGLRALAALAEAPLANAEVFLADGGGNPIPGLPAARTDAEGRYSFAGIPPGFTFVVAARIKDAKGNTGTLRSVTSPGALGATADVSGPTTLVAAALLKGAGGALGTFDRSTFSAAVQTTSRHVGETGQPDWTSQAGVATFMNELIASVAELRGSIDALRTELADIKATLADLQAALANLDNPGTGTPGPTPTPTPEPYPAAWVPLTTPVVVGDLQGKPVAGATVINALDGLPEIALPPGETILTLPASDWLALDVRAASPGGLAGGRIATPASFGGHNAGGLDILLNRRALGGALVNKAPQFRFGWEDMGAHDWSNGSTWAVLESPDYLAPDAAGAGPWRVTHNALAAPPAATWRADGACRYVWDVHDRRVPGAATMDVKLMYFADYDRDVFVRPLAPAASAAPVVTKVPAWAPPAAWRPVTGQVGQLMPGLQGHVPGPPTAELVGGASWEFSAPGGDWIGLDARVVGNATIAPTMQVAVYGKVLGLLKGDASNAPLVGKAPTFAFPGAPTAAGLPWLSELAWRVVAAPDFGPADQDVGAPARFVWDIHTMRDPCGTATRVTVRNVVEGGPTLAVRVLEAGQAKPEAAESL